MNAIKPYDVCNLKKSMPVVMAGTVLAVLDADTVDVAIKHLKSALKGFLERSDTREGVEPFYISFKKTLSTKFEEAKNSLILNLFKN